MSDLTLLRVLELVTNEIICGLLRENIPRGGLFVSVIRRNFRDKIVPEYIKRLTKILTSECSKKEVWKTIVRSFSDVECSRGKFFLRKCRGREATSEIILDNLSIEDYRLEILYQMTIILVDYDLEDVNEKDKSGNTLLHLVASLPTENEDDINFQANVLKLLIDASADCSLKNDQGMTPLHMIAGNYLLDPKNGFVLSHKRGLSSECNTNGRLQKLSIFEPFIQKPFMARGQYGNSILHEWVTYCSGHDKMSTNEREIGKWIFDIANVPLTNNYYDSTALHYAFINDLVAVLCQHKSESGTTRLTADGDAPMKRHRRGEATSKLILENLSIEEYRLKILYQMIIILLDGNLGDVNQKGMNGNTLLHLVASLPTESEDDINFQINVLKLLIDASDCLLKNDQGMTPLHMIAGNYLLDPNSGFVLSHKRGLSNECNTNGRLQKLSIFEPFIQKPCMERGRYGNSILHEWVIYCSGHNKMSTIEKQIGGWIIQSANVPTYLANEYNCTALHYAFTDDLIKVLCQHKSEHDTDRLNADGDKPFMHIFKHGLLRRLANIANETHFEVKLAAEMDINFNSDPNNGKPITTNGKIVDDLNLETFAKNGFDVASCDGTKRNCLDYLLAFVNALLSHCKESPQFQEVLKYIVENWIQSLLKSGGAFDNAAARENTFSTLINVFFKVASNDKVTADIILGFIKELCERGANQNMTPRPDTCSFLHCCCIEAIDGNDLHLRLLEIVCQNCHNKIASDELKTLERVLFNSERLDILQIIKDTKPKRIVTMEIQSERYKDQLDSLSRQVSPQRISDDCLTYRYDSNLIGKGAISLVFLAIDEEAKREIALKRIDKQCYEKQYTAEIKALKDLEQNQNVINFYNAKETTYFYYLAIELMDGDLTALVKEKSHHLEDEATMQQLAADILRGMEFLHSKGKVHRDINPGNILYREKPNLTLKLADFGLSKNLNDCEQSTVQSTNSTSLCGTRGWMAPELVKRTQPSTTTETDMFAMGLVLHFLFSKGYHPFHSNTNSLVQDLSDGKLRAYEIELRISERRVKFYNGLNEEQRHLVMLLLQDDPKRRPPSKGLLQQHCYFWSRLKKFTFMCKIGDQPEVANPTSTPTSSFGTKLQESQLGKQVSKKAWSTLISVDLFNELSSRRQYNTSSILDLIRFFRNAYAHYEERSSGSQVEILNDQIFKKFPEFFVTVWMEVLAQGWTEEGSGRDMLRLVIK